MNESNDQEIIPVLPNQAQLDIIFYHGAYPLWKFLIQKFGIDIREVCERVAKDEPILPIGEKKLALRTVPDDYQCNLDESYNSDKTFLLNCANVVFNTLKEGIIKNGEHILQPYKFALDDWNNMFLQLDDDPTIDESHELESFNDAIKLGLVDVSDES